MNPIVVVIPIYKNDINSFEMISLQQCFSVLKSHTIVFVSPNHLKNSPFLKKYANNSQIVFLDDKNFESITTYNHMLLSVWFYEIFEKYEYMLIHQLDSFIFKDELNFWMKKEYSYIGAPWFVRDDNFNFTKEIMGVGNGGFSLRKIADCIEVLKSSKKIYSLPQSIKRQKTRDKYLYSLKGIKNYLKNDAFNQIKDNEYINEDKMFSQASHRFSFFKIPSYKEAMQFAFEANPTYLYQLNDNKLPMGCHAWEKYEPMFYKTFIESYGYSFNSK